MLIFCSPFRYLQALFSSPVSDTLSLRLAFNCTDGLCYYQTMSICPTCVAIDKLGVRWLEAEIVERSKRVLLEMTCPKHGKFSILYCKNAQLFRRLLRPSLPDPCQKTEVIPLGFLDSREAAQQAKFSVRKSCSIVDVVGFEKDRLLTVEEMAAALDRIQSEDVRFIVRVLGKITTDVSKLNDLVNFVRIRSGCLRTLVEVPYDRIIPLCQLKDSALLHASVYPSIKYFLRRGEEEQCFLELATTLGELCQFKGIQATINLCVEKPLPHLGRVLDLMRRHKDVIRVVCITLSRPVVEVVRCAQPDSARSEADMADVDYSDILDHLQIATENELLGKGKYNCKPSPSMGCMCVLLNYENYQFYPLLRLLDLNKLYVAMQPIINEWRQFPKGRHLSLLARSKEILRQCIRPNVPLTVPPTLSAAMDFSSYTRALNDLTDSCQYLIVKRALDVGSVDVHDLIAPGEYTTLTEQLLESL
eukprot:m.191896 g.191896  ORF g.191896 m.191896 type:complete len:475 (+) comp25725_c0_seq4:117-1541(+)